VIGRLGGKQQFKNSAKPRRQRRHAQRRFRERFDEKLNDNQYQQLLNQIKKGRAILLRQKTGSSIWRVKLDGKKFKCVYDKKTKMIVTIYP
jgi:hypothetical protein